MRRVFTPILLGLCLAGPGCSFVRQIKLNLIREPQYACDEIAIHHRAERLARQAWDEMARQYGSCFSEDYRRGFIDGFVDYLVYGGCVGGAGEAPLVPPVPAERYRHKKYMNPQGYRAMEDWFVGFRHGASTAMASGLRQLVVIPVINPPNYQPGQLAVGPNEPVGAGAPQPPAAPGPEGELLPTPRTIPPGPVPAGPPAPPAAGPAPMPPANPAPAKPVPPPAGPVPLVGPVPPPR
jgi:hypothetical protein